MLIEQRGLSNAHADVILIEGLTGDLASGPVLPQIADSHIV